MQKGIDRMEAANVKNISLTDFDTTVSVAAEMGYIKAEDKERLIQFRNNPSDESWIK
jgi:orotate phosphoribosyltransferase